MKEIIPVKNRTVISSSKIQKIASYEKKKNHKGSCQALRQKKKKKKKNLLLTSHPDLYRDFTWMSCLSYVAKKLLKKKVSNDNERGL